MSVREKMLNFLNKENGRNTFSVAQARAMWRIENVAARILELRQEGHVIYTNPRKRGDGSVVAVYRMGRPTKSFVRDALDMGISYT